MNERCTLCKTRSASNANVLLCCQVDCINQLCSWVGWDFWMTSATALQSFPTLSGGALHLVQQIQCKFPVSSSVQGYAASNQWGHHVTTCENDQSTHKMWMKGEPMAKRLQFPKWASRNLRVQQIRARASLFSGWIKSSWVTLHHLEDMQGPAPLTTWNHSKDNAPVLTWKEGFESQTLSNTCERTIRYIDLKVHNLSEMIFQPLWMQLFWRHSPLMHLLWWRHACNTL